MKIFERARDIIINPKVAWGIIKDEQTDVRQLFINYAAPLALIPSVAGLIGITLIGIRLPDGEVIRAPFIQALISSAAGYFLNLTAVLLMAWLTKLMAPAFSAKTDLAKAAAVIVYSLTPVWLVGIFSAVPGLGVLSLLGLYGIYLLALGLRTVLKAAGKKLVLYTISILFTGLIVSFILSVVVITLFYGPMFLQMMAA